jgi:uncharacterized protein (TIGR00251 family)
MIIKVKIIPNAHKNSIEGFQEDTLKIKIKAPPDKGKANEELIDFLSDIFSIAKSQIRIISGHSSRLKKIEIQAILDLTTFIKN